MIIYKYSKFNIQKRKHETFGLAINNHKYT